MSKRKKLLSEAMDVLEQSIVYHEGRPIGCVAAQDDEQEQVNYDQVFVRDFAVAGLAFLLQGQTKIVRNFLREVLHLQNHKVVKSCFQPAAGAMPVSFKVVKQNGSEEVVADYGEKAIGRVAPVDAVLWWLLLLRAYDKTADDADFVKADDTQAGIRAILDLLLQPRFDMFPTLFVPDGSFMIDRRLGVYGHPLDIQVLFFTALRAARELLIDGDTNNAYRQSAAERLGHLKRFIGTQYWLDTARLNELYRTDVEGYGVNAKNPLNVYPDTIPEWLLNWLPNDGGFFVGNLGPGRMDFRFFTAGNLLAGITNLSTEAQQRSVLATIEAHWDNLVGDMPMKVCYPALEGRDWQVLTGSDPKNRPWSYQNAGGWPFLLWLLAAACVDAERNDLLHKALDAAEPHIRDDGWQEYYDGTRNRLIGRESKAFQTWTAAGYIIACNLLEKPRTISLL